MEVFTSISNSKDKPRDDIRVLSGYDKFKSPVMNAKIYKILAHKYITDISIWLDGNIYLLVPPEQIVKEWLGDADMAVFEHNHHWTIRQEVEVIRKMFKSRPWIYEEAKKQIKNYPDLPLSMCGMIIRRNTSIVERFNEAWWAEICRGGQRDQLSFPVVLRRFPDLKVNYIKGNIKNHPYLRYENHQHYNS
ncbi:MAG: glycosyltransferase domain-containing protein [Candidatus Hodarchaeales archaeon]